MLRLCVFLCLLICAGFARAHPHVWIETDLKMLTIDGLITGVRAHLVFDEFYSETFLADADFNQNGTFDDSERARLIERVFVQGQEDLYPLMLVKPQGVAAPFTIQNPDVGFQDGMLYYTFDIVLNVPQPIKGAHQFAVYDPEFYLSFDQAVSLALPAAVQCEQHIEEEESISLYMGMVHPEVYYLNCK